MNRPPPPPPPPPPGGGVDLSFLKEEEARQIFQVLERDSRLKRAERERISKLYKEKEYSTELPGVTGEWFQEIQRRKFQNDSDVSRMFKQPLAHRLRKAIGNDPANTKTSGTQKHVSPSILGGLRTPLASFFSSFRKSKRQQNPKPQQKPQDYSPRYDHFAAGAHMSSKVEEMAKTEACDSPLPSEPTKKCFEANQTETLDDTSCTWNEQLENELLRVLGSLDDQLAQEQSQDVVSRRTPTHCGSRASEIDHRSTATRHSFDGGVQRNERSMFLSDGTRTLRAKDERQMFFRPRVFYDTYMKRHYTEDLTYGDGYNRRFPALKRGHSACSLGHSSEGSLQLSSGQQSSGFAHRDFMTRDIVSRSYSLSCLARGQSLTSVDQLSTGSLQHPLGSNRGFTQKSYHYQTKRIPLSSIAWNKPQTSEHPLYGDRLLRTQSLMEFGPAFEDTSPCIPRENAGYDFYRSKMDYRRAVPNPAHSRLAGNTDSLYFDKHENYLLHQMERNNWKPRYRYPSFHSRMNLSRKSFPSGRIEEQLFRPDNAQYYNDEVFLASDSSHEGFPTNVGDWQNPCAKKPGLRLRQWENDAQIHVGNMDHPEGITGKLFSKHADGIQRCPTYSLSVKRQTEFAVQRQNLFTQNAQTPSRTFVKHFQPKKNFKTHTIEGVKGPGQSGKVNSGYTQEETLRRVSGQMDTNSPAESQISPPTHCSVGVPPLSLRSPDKLTSLRNRENIYLSNIHNKKGQRNEDGCTVNCDLAQMPPSQITTSDTRALIQSLQRAGHQSETPKDVIHSKTSKNIYSSVSRKGSETLAYNELPGATENWHKHNRFVKHATSNSITGSPSNSPPRSPVTYHTLPRKSASIDGSVVSDKPVSHPFRQVPNRNKVAMWDNLEMLEANGSENIYSDKRENMVLLSPTDSSLSPSSKEVTCKEIPQTQDCHLQLTQDPKHPLGDPSAIPSKTEKEDLVCCPDKTETSAFSECEGKDAGNPLKQYKTTSTLTVSIEEDNVKYHELISVYYTLPRKRSRTLCNLFLDDTKNTDSSPAATGKSLPTEKKYEVRVNLATVAFLSSLQKEEKKNLPTKMSSTPSMQQNSNTSGDATKKSAHALNPVGEKAGASQSMAHDKEEAVGSQTEALKLLFSNSLGSGGPLDDPKHGKSEDDSLHTVTSTLHNLRIHRGLSSLTEGSKAHTQLNLHSSNPTEGKISLGNHLTASSAVYVQKDNHMCYLTSTEPPTSTNPHIPPSHLSSNDQEGECTAHPDFNTTVNSTEDKITQDIEVKERPHSYVCHKKSSKKGNELQIRNENVKSSTHNALTSEIKIDSNFQNQTLQMDAISPENSVRKPNRSGLDYSNTEEKPISQNSLLHKVCTNSQRPVRNSSDNQNLNSKDQPTNTTKDPPDESAVENKLSLGCTKDKASDIEKRKNRSSIKNKLAAMYKTSRKFSSKKTMSPKPHISNIFSQNDAPLLEINNPSSMLMPSTIPQLPLQTGNENQNQNPLPDESEDTMLDKTENKKLQTNEGLQSLSSEIRRPFTNLCNQKWESPSPKQSGKKIGITQNSTALFSKEIISKVHSNPQLCVEGLKNNNQSTFSSVIITVPDQEKKDSTVAEPSVFPLSSNKNSNTLTTNYSKANICPPQEVISPTESSHHQNIKQTSRLRKLNQSSEETVLNPSKVQRERHFSENSYVQESHNHLVSGSSVVRPGSKYSRKFKSYSELLSCDENENWDAYDGNSRAFGSRRVMYPSIEFGIFGKEQQQAFLDNIKRSLTEGRLWRPYLLNNPRSLKKEDGFPLNSPEQLNSSFAKTNVSAEGASRPFEIHKDPADYSESDSDTTTDDEYYLDENDKESEL